MYLLRPKNPTKKLDHVRVLLGHMLSQNHAAEICDPGSPLMKAIYSILYNHL